MYLKSTILEGLVEGLLEGLQLIGLYSGHVGFCMYIAPPRTSLRGNPPASLSNQDYDFLCMTVEEALEFHQVSQRFQVRKCRLRRLPGDLGRSTNRPERHFLVCQQQKQQSLQCRLVSMARSPRRPRQLWLCRLQIGRPRIPVYQ